MTPGWVPAVAYRSGVVVRDSPVGSGHQGPGPLTAHDSPVGSDGRVRVPLTAGDSGARSGGRTSPSSDGPSLQMRSIVGIRQLTAGLDDVAV